MTRERILIVEDENITAMSVRLMLEDLGYGVTGIVSTGEEAIQAISEDCPDLVLMDIGLKGNMDGIQAAEEILQRYGTAVIFATAYGSKDFLNKAKQCNPFGYIIKPYTKLTLSSAVELAIYRQRMENQLKASEERFHIIADFTHDWEYWIGVNGEMIYTSPSCQRITGHQAQEFMENPALLATIVHPEDRDKFEQHLRNEHKTDLGATDIDFRIITCQGEERWINHVCQPVNGINGEFLGRRGSNRDISNRKLAEQKANYMAGHDSLTGIPNRSLFMDRLEWSLSMGRRNNTTVTLLYIDLDDFKPINDIMGHNAGDEVLKETAVRLKTCMRESDTVARLGGDEFAVILTETIDREVTSKMAQKIIDVLSQPFHIDDKNAVLSASIGIASSSPNVHQSDNLLLVADEAMYAAKKSGKGKYKFAPPM